MNRVNWHRNSRNSNWHRNSGYEQITLCSVNGKDVTLGQVARNMKIQGKWTLMDEAVSEAIIAEAIAANSITVSKEELQKAVNDFRSASKLYNADETNIWLDKQGLSHDDLENCIERQIAIDKLKQGYSDGEINKYYFDNRKSFEKAKLSQISCGSREAAEEIKTQIEDDEEDFGVLAVKHSTDKVTAEAGGFMGWISRDALTPKIEAHVFGASVGEILGPIETDADWCLLKVWEISGRDLDADLSATIRGALFSQWLADEAARAEID